jgi:hypothetical protein
MTYDMINIQWSNILNPVSKWKHSNAQEDELTSDQGKLGVYDGCQKMVTVVYR